MRREYYYTGVGSKIITAEEEDIIYDVSFYCAVSGGILRSGCAEGSDYWFEEGYAAAYDKVDWIKPPELFVPWAKFEPNVQRPWDRPRLTQRHLGRHWDEAVGMVKNIHPAPHRLTQGMYKLHTRNMFQPLGPWLDNPSKFLLFCSDTDRHGLPKGGTRTAVILAKQYGIPCFNIRNSSYNDAIDFIDMHKVNEKWD